MLKCRNVNGMKIFDFKCHSINFYWIAFNKSIWNCIKWYMMKWNLKPTSKFDLNNKYEWDKIVNKLEFY